ncbi:protoporphyrinogen oxidase [Halalkalibacterium ligniniphilum]|uniref:protoporphyrinogen oxidase n=1 Tax=Halalkalibacterium ligniniphilum TaxID=1134413 RepID=UPI0003483EEF|nr:protoporphyrinogen oxidase [Halalkalibacterium ligniniphilum]
MTSKKTRVAVIGGGITGLAAAHALHQKKHEQGFPLDYVLIEGCERLGGKIQTDRTDGFVIERGPDSFLARKTSMSKLAKAVGLENDLLHNDTGQAYILKGASLHPIPGGAIMGIPTELGPFLKTNLFSPLGKIRAASDFFIPPITDENEDISLGHFFRRRLGNEVVDQLIEPLLSGIYAGNLDKLSLQATFPNFQQLEKKYGGLIRGMKKTRGTKKKPEDQSEKKQGMFLTFRYGLQSFVDAIENHLDADSIWKGNPVVSIRKERETFLLTFQNGSIERFDEVIVTTPPHITAKMLDAYPYYQYLKEMEATSVATVALAFRKEAVHNPYDGTGFVVSRNSPQTITACTWTHKKWSHSTPEGFALLRCYIGRPGDSEIVDKSDEEIVSVVLRDLKGIMDIEGEPLFHLVTRWKEAMPQYHVGHVFQINKMKEDTARHLPGLYLAGAGFDGVGLPDCIDQGQQVVEQIVRKLI